MTSRRSPRQLRRIQYYNSSSDDEKSDNERSHRNNNSNTNHTTTQQLSYTLPNPRRETPAGQPLPNNGNISIFYLVQRKIRGEYCWGQWYHNCSPTKVIQFTPYSQHNGVCNVQYHHTLYKNCPYRSFGVDPNTLEWGPYSSYLAQDDFAHMGSQVEWKAQVDTWDQEVDNANESSNTNRRSSTTNNDTNQTTNNDTNQDNNNAHGDRASGNTHERSNNNDANARQGNYQSNTNDNEPSHDSDSSDSHDSIGAWVYNNRQSANRN